MLIFVTEKKPIQNGNYKLTILTVFASLLKDVPMGRKDAVLLEPLLRNCNVKCLTFERNTKQPYSDNLCLFKALGLHLHGNETLEEEKTSKTFNRFRNNSEEGIVSKFQSPQLKNIRKLKTCCNAISSCMTDW